jgi:chromate transport protein ChrA
MTHLSEQTKHLLDALSIGTVIATLASWLPPLAALISIVWGLLRIYESRTVQRILRRRQRNK